MFVENFRKFVKYYGKGQKFKLFCFFLFSLMAGFLEFAGIALIYPFILLIIKPSSVIHNKYYLQFAHHTHMNNYLINAFYIGLIVALIFIFKNLFMVFTLFLQNKFLNGWKMAINKKFMHYYLFAPYKNTIKTSPSEKIYNLTFLVSQAIDGFIYRIIYLVANAIIVILILGLLFAKFPFAALVTSLFVAFSMSLQNKYFKNKIQDIAEKFSKVSALSNEKTLENINNLKEIKIMSTENYFFNNYLATQKNYYKVLSENNFYGGIPPFIVEVLIVLALFILAGIISLQSFGNMYWLIASYAVVVAAIFRIAPALNRIQSSLNIINTSRDFAKTLIVEYENSDFKTIEKEVDIKVEFNESIKLNNISFSYRKNPVIKDLNLEIKKGDFIGIIGLSGAGKSTLADIIMGLLPIDSGEVYVDDIKFNRYNFSALRKLIGYVPQQINVLEGTFKRNVAWGVDEDKIDEEKVVEALKKARLFDFVSQFDNGINTNIIVGAAGLSQGQKQRLAIARALYKDPEILIFDEATSSLDVETEHEITQMLASFKGDKTIIAIAHRLSTLKSCDKLIYLKSGKIVDIGTFSQLSERHTDFEKMVRLSQFK